MQALHIEEYPATFKITVRHKMYKLRFSWNAVGEFPQLEVTAIETNKLLLSTKIVNGGRYVIKDPNGIPLFKIITGKSGKIVDAIIKYT